MWLRIAIALLGINLAYGDNGQEAAARQQRILAAYSTRTLFSMTTTTVTSFYTCASSYAPAPNTCTAGRKMRRYTVLEDEDLQGDRSERSLEGSLSEEVFDSDSDGSAAEDGNREGRIALTVWSTTTTPYTWTSTSINSSTTFSLSYWCSIVGMDFPPFCG